MAAKKAGVEGMTWCRAEQSELQDKAKGMVDWGLGKGQGWVENRIGKGT